MMNPYEAAKSAATKQVDLQGLLDTIRIESAKAAEAAQGPQLVPGTGGKTPGMIMQESQARLQAQQQTQKVAAAADWENLSVLLGQDIAQLTQQSRALTEKIVEDSSVSLFEDPFTAIANAFTLPWDEQELDAVNQKLTTTTAMANAAHSHIQQSARTADAIATKITEADLADQATALEALQVQQAAEARIAAAKSGADGIRMALDMDSRQLDLYLKQRQLENSEEQMDLARQREARQREILDRQLAAIKDKDEIDNYNLRLANAALVAEGKTPLDDIGIKRLRGSSAKLFDALVEKGMKLAITGRQNHTHGATIEERDAWRTAINWQPQTPQQESAILMQRDAWQQAAAAVTDKKAIPAAANTLFKKQFIDGQKNIREGSMFAAPAWSVFANTPESKTLLWQKYIAPTLTEESSKNSVDPKLVINAAKQAVVNREVTSAEAADVVKSLFSRAITVNNEVNRFKLITGLEQTRFAADIGAPGYSVYPFKLAGAGKPVELTDTVQIQAALQRLVALEMVGRASNLFGNK
jgi:putative ubiquitin-RnfH superfamily antitoxin RatB of RatAB toxin-antitoxin module